MRFGQAAVQRTFLRIEPQRQQVVATGNGGRQVCGGGNAFVPNDCSVVKTSKAFEQFVQTPDPHDLPPRKPATRLDHLVPPKVVRLLQVMDEKPWTITIYQAFQCCNQMCFVPETVALAFVIQVELEKIREVEEDNGFGGNCRCICVAQGACVGAHHGLKAAD